jgi:polar amino acid transport system substrate-binding protein
MVIITLMGMCFPALAETVKLGTEDILYFPLHGRLHNLSDEFSGFAREFFDEFSSQTDVNIVYVPLPIKRIYKSLIVDQSIDLKFPDNPSWQSTYRKGVSLIYSDPIIQFTDGVLIKTANIDSSLFQLEILGSIRGFTPVPYLKQITSGALQLVEFSNTSELLLAVANDKIDGAYLNVDVAAHQIKVLFSNQPGLTFAKNLPFNKGYYHLSTVNNKAVIVKFNAFMKKNVALKKSLLKKFNIPKI